MLDQQNHHQDLADGAQVAQRLRQRVAHHQQHADQKKLQEEAVPPAQPRPGIENSAAERVQGSMRYP
ncbi:hypothetical protein [Cyanobium sp. ATX-6F1]|uniref:hypothetical protein n=1 Tax=Cyanobium sp. ATX-6F1 TaxID=3137388 RepID=UPI0039BE5A49